MTTITDDERRNAQDVYYLPANGEDPFNAEPSQEEKDFADFIDEMRESDQYAKITVSRQPTDSQGRPIGRKLYHLFECGIDDYTFSQLCSRIREDYGTGLYKIQGRDSGGKFKFGKTVGVEAPKNAMVKHEDKNDIGRMIDQFSAALERQHERTEQFMSRVLGPTMRQNQDPIEQMTKMMAAMGAMMGAMGLNPAHNQPKTLVEQLTEFKMIKELFGDSDGGSDHGEANIFSLLTETVKNFGPLLAAATIQGQKDGTVSPAGIIQPKPKRLINPMSEQERNELNQLQAMKPQLQFLMKQCKGGADPEDVADFVIDSIPDEHLEIIEEFLSQDNVIQKCARVMPEISDHAEWFENWRTRMLANLAKIFDPGDDDLTDGDDFEDTSPDAVAGIEQADSNEPQSDGDASRDT